MASRTIKVAKNRLYLNLCRIMAYSGLCCVVLVACKETEPVDWIEVPLQERTYFGSTNAFKEGNYEILVLRKSALEYKLGVNAGDAIIYNWNVAMAQPELLSVEFHGHTNRIGTEPGTVMFYKIHADGEERGALVAPFDGIHGWYLDNQSDEDITVMLNVAGFYQTID